VVRHGCYDEVEAMRERAIASEGCSGKPRLAACGEDGYNALERRWPQRGLVLVPVEWATHCEAASVVCNFCRGTRRHS
jgi:hypothetical protein